MDKQKEFEKLMSTCKNALERLVFYKVNNKTDGEDILQAVYLAAFSKFDTLGNKDKFKTWIIAIARNKINDFYREKARTLELPLDENICYETSFSRIGLTVDEVVNETLTSLADKEKQILYLHYIKQKSQKEIAKTLGIPLGTVKSRLYTAKRRFREKYPYPPISKGEKYMSKLPDIMPGVKITKIKTAELYSGEDLTKMIGLIKNISKSGVKDCRKMKRSTLMVKLMSISMTV